MWAGSRPSWRHCPSDLERLRVVARCPCNTGTACNAGKKKKLDANVSFTFARIAVTRRLHDNKHVLVAVSIDGKHRFSKVPRLSVTLVAGHGIEGDAHYGQFVKRRYLARRYPRSPNLRQVHLLFRVKRSMPCAWRRLRCQVRRTRRENNGARLRSPRPFRSTPGSGVGASACILDRLAGPPAS